MRTTTQPSWSSRFRTSRTFMALFQQREARNARHRVLREQGPDQGISRPGGAGPIRAREPVNGLAESWEGEAPSEPIRVPARTEPRPPGIAQDDLLGRLRAASVLDLPSRRP